MFGNLCKRIKAIGKKAWVGRRRSCPKPHPFISHWALQTPFANITANFVVSFWVPMGRACILHCLRPVWHGCVLAQNAFLNLKITTSFRQADSSSYADTSSDSSSGALSTTGNSAATSVSESKDLGLDPRTAKNPLETGTAVAVAVAKEGQ